MAIFNKNTLAQISGFDNQIMAGELVWDQQTSWNLSFNNGVGEPLDMSNATVEAKIVRRRLSNIRDSRYGLTFDIADYTPTPPVINLPVNVINAQMGSYTLIIDSGAWNLMATDPGLEINATDPVGYSGRVKVSFPQEGMNPPDDSIIFLLFLVRSDGEIVL